MLEIKRVITDQDATASALKQKIEEHSAQIGVIGLGYVGLPLAVEKGKVGFPVLGFDINPARAAKVNAGENYIGDYFTLAAECHLNRRFPFYLAGTAGTGVFD